MGGRAKVSVVEAGELVGQPRSIHHRAKGRAWAPLLAVGEPQPSPCVTDSMTVLRNTEPPSQGTTWLSALSCGFEEFIPKICDSAEDPAGPWGPCIPSALPTQLQRQWGWAQNLGSGPCNVGLHDGVAGTWLQPGPVLGAAATGPMTCSQVRNKTMFLSQLSHCLLPLPSVLMSHRKEAGALAVKRH